MNEDTTRIRSLGSSPAVEPATITERGSLVYTCAACGVQHWHGAADHELGDRVHRVRHCMGGVGGVLLEIVADERKAAA